jgi:D-alanyl-D-alanine carboxypeptidase (penicillin-binding protein 5/6)
MALTRGAKLLSILVLLLILSSAVAWQTGSLGWGSQAPHRSPLRSISIDWPSEGESAIAVVGSGHRISHPSSQRVPIASVAKVMTAYVVMHRFPLRTDDPGFTMTISDSDAEATTIAADQGQSVVPVVAGEQLTEREALEALLLPSANNIAIALASRTAGSVSAFIQLMNQQASTLRMTDTTYTDPSGYAITTVSTARDQLRLARTAMRVPAFQQIVGMREATIPVVGAVTNTNSLLGHDGFVGGKTGSDTAAGGCFMFEAIRQVQGRQIQLIGVVLGQRNGPLIAAALAAADSLVNSVVGRLSLRR